MLRSMTGFASLSGAVLGWNWTWDIKSVNARGLDIRVRLPDWIDGIEAPTRAALGKNVARGSVAVALRVTRDEAEGDEAIDPQGLARALSRLKEVSDAAEAEGLALAKPTASDILAIRGVLATGRDGQDTKALSAALTGELPKVIAAVNEMRVAEGAALAEVLEGHLSDIDALTTEAAGLAEARKGSWAAKLQDNLARVLDSAEGADPDRVAQELAMIAVKADVTEEIDRLRAHVVAARDLLAGKGPVGRKLDFLAQEFNREANTLCSKAQASDLTRVGLDLKAVIDQMREQVQNVE
ncbi:MAG: YicC/YloC family endoribonuclease [Pseudomonadota bacterium]